MCWGPEGEEQLPFLLQDIGFMDSCNVYRGLMVRFDNAPFYPRKSRIILKTNLMTQEVPCFRQYFPPINIGELLSHPPIVSNTLRTFHVIGYLPRHYGQTDQAFFAITLPVFSSRGIFSPSLEGCSCQFTSCWKLPCRHQFRLLLELSGNEMTDAEILSKFPVDDLWLGRTEADNQDDCQIKNLLQRIRTSPRSNTTCACGGYSVLTESFRFVNFRSILGKI